MPVAPFEDVLAAGKHGEAWAFEALYRSFGPLVLRFFRTQEQAEAEDLTSDVFVSVAESIVRFSGDETAFRAWIFTIAHRRLIDHRRRWVRRESHLQMLRDRGSAHTSPDAEDEAIVMLTTSAAMSRIADLPPAQAEALLLRVVADLSAEQIGRIVGRRPDAVRALQHRALRRLARQLDADPTVTR